jgi:AcrR family transcriptional regulator
MGAPAKSSLEPLRRGRKPDTPYGRDEVRAALIASAAELFAARGPARVPLREIADHAKVNLGQISRHFGNKEALLAAVIEHIGKEIGERSSGHGEANLDQILSFFDATGSSHLWQIIARSVLDGYDLGSLQNTFPLVRSLVELVERESAAGRLAPEFDPRTTAAVMAAVGLGWLMFEPFLTAAAGINDRPHEKILGDVHAILAGGFLRIVTATPSPEGEGPPEGDSP